MAPLCGLIPVSRAKAIAKKLKKKIVACSFMRSTGPKARALAAGDLAANQVLPLSNCGTLTELLILSLSLGLSFLIGKMRSRIRKKMYVKCLHIPGSPISIDITFSTNDIA